VKQSFTRDFQPENAVAAIILTPDNDCLLQLRDSIDGIFYPGFLGCFGGAIENFEADEEALIREIEEELSIKNYQYTHFSTINLDFTPINKTCVYRRYFVINLDSKNMQEIRLNEGAALIKIKLKDLSSADYSIVPYDAFALDLYLASCYV
jgi:8-oxo-dGTP pyrophosphatase MutT (NUDIX family)